jgi:hypothetical protein
MKARDGDAMIKAACTEVAKVESTMKRMPTIIKDLILAYLHMVFQMMYKTLPHSQIGLLP